MEQPVSDVQSIALSWDGCDRILINGQGLDSYLNQATGSRDFSGLVPPLGLLSEEDQRSTALRWKMSTGWTPVLVCGDDLDFSCTVVSALVTKEGEYVHWRSFAYGLEGQQPIAAPPLKFPAQMYAELVEDLAAKIAADRILATFSVVTYPPKNDLAQWAESLQEETGARPALPPVLAARLRQVWPFLDGDTAFYAKVSPAAFYGAGSVLMTAGGIAAMIQSLPFWQAMILISLGLLGLICNIYYYRLNRDQPFIILSPDHFSVGRPRVSVPWAAVREFEVTSGGRLLGALVLKIWLDDEYSSGPVKGDPRVSLTDQALVIISDRLRTGEEPWNLAMKIKLYFQAAAVKQILDSSGPGGN